MHNAKCRIVLFSFFAEFYIFFGNVLLKLVVAHQRNNHSMITTSTADTYRKIFIFMSIPFGLYMGAIASTIALVTGSCSATLAKPLEISANTKKAEILTKRAAASNLIVESEEALSLCNAALSQDSKYPPAYITRAEAYISLGKPDAALVDLTKASQSANIGHRTKALRERASLYIVLKRYREALSDLNVVIKNQGSDGQYRLRAKCFAALQKPDLAAQDLTAALRRKQHPDSLVLEERANYYLAANQLDKALTEYNALIRADEAEGDGLANDSLYKNRARVYQLLGQTKLANLDLKKASEKQKSTFENSPFRSKNRHY